ncbi:MAG: VWA domain-containing protein [Desulfobacterales bacterium]
MENVLLDFITALRHAGVRISVAENMDAMNAARLVGYADRRMLKTALSATLAKSRREQEIFETCFERFFSVEDARKPPDTFGEAAESEMPADLSDLGGMLMAGDTAGLGAALEQSAENARVKNIVFFTQKSLYMRRILQGMGIAGLEEDIKKMGMADDPAVKLQGEHLQQAKSVLVDYVRNYVEKQYSLYAGNVPEELLERFLKDTKLSNVEERDFHRMQALIKKMVKRLNDVHSRRKKTARRGWLDLKKTLRANIAYQGIIIDPKWKTKKEDRPDIVAICDVSRSVEAVVRFFLLFLYSLNDSLARVRSFVFCSNLVEVGHVFENYKTEAALDRILRGTGLDLQFSATDYGRAFLDFKEKWLDRVTRKTTILVLGDARNNFGKPRTDILKLLQERSKRIIWLNPEPVSFWGTGDSEMKRYMPYCFMVRECSTVNHIKRIVDYMLK